MKRIRLGLFLIALAHTVPAAAQIVVNPSVFEFIASADHNTVQGGVPLLSQYELEIYGKTPASLLQSIAVGKPAPDADGKIRIDFAAVASSTLMPGQIYTADVVAVGPGGRAPSSVAPDSFYFACTYSLSELNQSIASSGGSGMLGVKSGTGCTWTATETVKWLMITSGASGSGSGTVNYTATANTSLSPRTATLTVAGVAATITQPGTGCTYSASPSSQSVAVAGGTAAIAVTAPTGCAWTATETADWLMIRSGATGSGNGTIGYAASANTSTTTRATTLMIASTAVAITQPAAACSYGTSPGSQSFTAAGGPAVVTVTATSGCVWTTSEDSAWLTIGSAAGGSGDGTVSYTAAANTSAASRMANLTVAGRLINVTQAGAGCSFVVAPTDASIAAAGGDTILTVTTTAGCSWTAAESVKWLEFTSAPSGSAAGTLGYRVSANPSTNPRSAVLTVAGRSVTVNQAGKRR